MTSPPSRKKQKNAFCFRFGPCLCVVYALEEESQTERTRGRERERERENSARSAPLLKRLKRRGKSCFLSLFLSSSLALTQTTAPKKRFDLSSSSSLFPPGSSSLAHVVFFPSLSFSRLVSRVKRVEIARFEIYIYIYTRARDQREVRRMNTPSEEEEKRRSAERREETMFKMSARSLMRILIWKGKDKKNKGSKKPASSLFLVCLAHFFFFALHLPFFHLFLS